MIAAAIAVKSLGQRIYEAVVLALLVLAVCMFAYGQYQNWRARSANERADTATAAAHTAQGNANSANAGAENASTTRTNIDTGTFTVRVETEQSAARIETYAQRPVPAADLAPVDADVVRELEAAEGRARAAADRLQRTPDR